MIAAELSVNPLRNEHSARLKNPDKSVYSGFRRVNDELGQGIHAIYGIRKSDDKTELIAIRFSKDKFTFQEAKDWIHQHDFHPIEFTAARPTAKQINGIIYNAESIPMREVIFEGKKHLVVPVTMAREQVMNGFFYPAAELRKNVEAWNNRPIPVWHPKRGETYISSNDPKTVEERTIGRIFNAWFDEANRALKAELWINIDKANRIAPRLIPMLRQGERVEVSTGLFSDHDGIAGEWNGQKFQASVKNIVPDHLAVLPGGKGACSWEDSCGIRAAEDDDNGPSRPRSGVKMDRGLKSMVRHLAHEMALKLDQMSHDDVRRSMQKALDGLNSPGWMHFVHRVFDDHVVYQAVGNNPNEPGSAMPQEKLFSRPYKMDEQGNVTLGAKVKEVRREENFVPVTSNEEDIPDGSGSAPAQNEGGNEESGDAAVNSGDGSAEHKEVQMGEKETLVNRLIACDKCPFEESDREWLMKQNEEKLQKLVPAEKPPETPPEKPEAKKEEPKQNEEKPKVLTMDEFLQTAPPEIRGNLARAVATDKARKDALVAGLLKNERCRFNKEQLEAKDIEELENMVELGRIPVDFSLAAGGPSPQANTAKVPPMPALFQGKQAAGK
jgi:hypothetical protein